MQTRLERRPRQRGNGRERRLLAAVRRAIAADPRVHPGDGFAVRWEAPAAISLDGQVLDLASKKLALRHAGAVPGVSILVDRLRVAPLEERSDREIRDSLARQLLQEAAFGELTLSARDPRERVLLRDAGPAARGAIDARVASGRVTLEGDVPSLSLKRLAGAMVWWVPGVNDVVDGLGVEPAARDDEREIVDGLRLVLEKDRLVDSAGLMIHATGTTVHLAGRVRTETQRHLVVSDAWSLFGVDDVVDEIQRT